METAHFDQCRNPDFLFYVFQDWVPWICPGDPLERYGGWTTAQFTFRFFNFKGKQEDNLWTSTKLEDFRCEGSNFYANGLSIELDKDNKLYTVKSSVNKDSVLT